MIKPIVNDVNNIIRNVFRKQHPILAEIVVNWGKIVGVKFSKNSIPLKIISSKERGKRINILYISSDNSSASMEISYHQELIIERIAVYLGYKGIHKIRFLVSWTSATIKITFSHLDCQAFKTFTCAYSLTTSIFFTHCV